MEQIKLMTYREISEALGIKIESAKAMRRRKNWKVVRPNSSKESLVEVPLSSLETELRPSRDTDDVTSNNSSDISAALIAQITAAHEIIGSLKLELKQARKLNENISQMEAEITDFKTALKERNEHIMDLEKELEKLRQQNDIPESVLSKIKKLWFSSRH
jgi:septal ring factor EnvC (AmiA/AmiB activator)